MQINNILGRRSLGLAATAALAIGLATTGSAAAEPPAGSASVSDDTLIVIGTVGADQLALRLAAGDPTTLQVDFGDDGAADASFDRATFTRIVVLLRNGDDRFRIDQANLPFADEAVTVDAGNGDDSVVGGDSNEVVLGGRGDDAIDLKHGRDTAFLGAGDDSFRWIPGDGSDAVIGEQGTDTLDFVGASGAETMRLAANGHDAVLLREQGTIRMDLAGVEIVHVEALGGADSITVGDLTGTDVRVADIDLSVDGAGDRSADLVTVNGTDDPDDIRVVVDGGRVDVEGLQAETRLTGAEAADLLQVNGLGGADTAGVDPAAAAVLGVTVDLGTGQI